MKTMQLKLLLLLVAVKKKNIVLTLAIFAVFALYFTVKTLNYDADADFQRLKSLQKALTSQKMAFMVRNSTAQNKAKRVSLFGKIDHNAITLTSSISSVVKSVAKEGVQLKKGDSVISFINGVSRPMPFNGMLLDTFIKKGDDVKIGDKLFIAIPKKIKNMSVNLEVPVSYSGQIKHGSPAIIQYKNKEIKGNIIYISNSSEDNLGVLKAVASTPFQPIPHNTVVKVFIETSQHKVHFVPKTALIIKENKVLVKIVKEDGTVDEAEVEIIEENSQGFFIDGLENKAKIIIRTPFYTKKGKKYQYIEEKI